jgi:hypothetical protein
MSLPSLSWKGAALPLGSWSNKLAQGLRRCKSYPQLEVALDDLRMVRARSEDFEQARLSREYFVLE